ncbi:MAG TPA: TraR/DksA family transcriptional regulator [Burkholderiales bacterium]|nr:TraR/DksA family transcriptional regulator [Burkholderiales bacterium]
MELTEDQVADLEARLRERQQLLRAEVDQRLQQSSEQRLEDLAGPVGDAGDESVAHMITDLDLAAATRDVTELREVEQALTRLADGEYGICVHCGGEIEYERLKAYPTALRCLACQTQYEKVYAGQGTPSL